MTKISRLFLALAMSASLPVFAQMPDCGPMNRGGQMHEQRAERMQQHQKQLHDALKLTPDQEAGWNKYAESMQPPPRPEGAQGDWKNLSTPERAEKMLELSKQYQERMTAHVAALKTFYASLTPEQKKTMDGFHGDRRGGRRGPPPADGAAPPPKQ